MTSRNNFVSPKTSETAADASQFVTRANNAGVPEIMPWGFLAALVVSLAVGLAMDRLSSWPAGIVAACAIISFCIVSLFGMIIASGDGLPALEIIAHWLNQRMAMRRHADHLDAQEKHRHVEKMRQLDIEESAQKLSSQLRQLSDQVRHLNQRLLTDGSGQTVVNDVSTFVDNGNTETRTMALHWVAENLYMDGKPHPENIKLPSGVIGCTVPWSARGIWRGTAAEDGRKFLMEDHRVVLPHAGNRYRLNLEDYPTLSYIGRI